MYKKGILYRYTTKKNFGKPNDISAITKDTFNGIIHDYQYWHTNKEAQPFAKPFVKNSKHLQIFFDDNIKEKSIVNPIGFGKVDLIKKRILVNVNPLDALLNKSYFIDYVSRLIQKEGQVSQGYQGVF
jgi:hypothetical protein